MMNGDAASGKDALIPLLKLNPKTKLVDVIYGGIKFELMGRIDDENVRYYAHKCGPNGIQINHQGLCVNLHTRTVRSLWIPTVIS